MVVSFLVLSLGADHSVALPSLTQLDWGGAIVRRVNKVTYFANLFRLSPAFISYWGRFTYSHEGISDLSLSNFRSADTHRPL